MKTIAIALAALIITACSVAQTRIILVPYSQPGCHLAPPNCPPSQCNDGCGIFGSHSLYELQTGSSLLVR